MRDYDYKFSDYLLEPFAVIRAKAPAFNSREAQEIEVTEWFRKRSSNGKVAIVHGLKSFPMQLTKAKLKALRPLVFVIEEAMKDPDEVYLFLGKKLYYYTYFKFYADRAVMIDISFQFDRPMRIDRLMILKPDQVDKKRKGTLYYEKQ